MSQDCDEARRFQQLMSEAAAAANVAPSGELPFDGRVLAIISAAIARSSEIALQIARVEITDLRARIAKLEAALAVTGE